MINDSLFSNVQIKDKRHSGIHSFPRHSAVLDYSLKNQMYDTDTYSISKKYLIENEPYVTRVWFSREAFTTYPSSD